MRTTRTQHCRSGQTLIELVVASGIILIALVPALRLTREGMKLGRQIETNSQLATRCASKLEEHLALCAANWTVATITGDFSPTNPELHFQVIRSDSAADGGLPGSLMAIQATVWEELDGDDQPSNTESQVTYATKLSRMASYEYEAQGM